MGIAVRFSIAGTVGSDGALGFVQNSGCSDCTIGLYSELKAKMNSAWHELV
jgi:hypothetical protein